ncbi:MAG: DUF4340 domain-containing protein [Planctomycetota bacterium]|nr:DUF4340 domain-containing protein [Planctomycetota bacterium]
MKETTRTFVFCGIAAIAVVGAFAAHRISQPPQLEGYDRVGEPFFPEFTDPTAAKGLRVAVYNAESAEIKLFDVVNKNGVWTIPSRHDYPADGADRLAETASSVIGITRGALESRREADFERLGVIDPLNESSTALKGRGQRLTISGDSEPPLADLIIGNPVPDKSNEYYVRRADEKEVYRTKLAINLSTKFADSNGTPLRILWSASIRSMSRKWHSPEWKSANSHGINRATPGRSTNSMKPPKKSTPKRSIRWSVCSTI